MSHDDYDSALPNMTLDIQRTTNSHYPPRDIERRMVIEMDRIIRRYMSRPDWSSPYRCRLEWNLEDPNVPSYSVLMIIREPTNMP